MLPIVFLNPICDVWKDVFKYILILSFSRLLMYYYVKCILFPTLALHLLQQYVVDSVLFTLLDIVSLQAIWIRFEYNPNVIVCVELLLRISILIRLLVLIRCRSFNDFIQILIQLVGCVRLLACVYDNDINELLLLAHLWFT